MTIVSAKLSLENVTTKKRSLSNLDLFIYVFLIIWCVSPPLSMSIVFRLGALLAVMVLMMRVLLKAVALKESKWLVVALPFLIISVTALSLLLNFFTSQINTLIFLCMTICAWNTRFNPPTRIQRQILIFVTFALSMVWIYFTLSAIWVYPNVMRLLAKNSAEGMYYISRGVGGFGFLYTMILMFPAGIGVATGRGEDRSLRILAFIFCICVIVLTYRSAYFLALLLLILNMSFLVIFRSAKKRAAILIFTLVFVLIGLLFAEYILEFLIRNIETPNFQYKLKDFYALLNSDINVEDSEFSTRTERYTRDLKLILSSPLWGCLSFNAVGKHSHLLDFAAIFGLPMAIIYIRFYWNTLKNFMRKHNAVFPTVLTAFLMLMMNSISYQFGCAIFILLPIFATGGQPQDGST
jgi:hypothetical protein